MDQPSASLDAINRKSYALKETLEQFRHTDGTKPAERAIFAKIADEARGKPILDIGAGGGRLVPTLRAMSEDYTAIDYTPEMVDIIRAKFPDARVYQEDARKLARFADGSFFLVVFAWNGIDSVDHEGRLAVLREVHRVLAPGGIFVFSSHNRDCPGHDRFHLDRFELTANPFLLGKRALGFTRDTIVSLYNRARLRRREIREVEYAILNDEPHRYSIMSYFIGIESAKKQLAAAGFGADVETFDVKGARIEGRCEDGTIHYLARRL